MDGQVISLGYKEVLGKAALPVLLLVYTFAGLKTYGKRLELNLSHHKQLD